MTERLMKIMIETQPEIMRYTEEERSTRRYISNCIKERKIE
jgi:hypothetical protein